MAEQVGHVFRAQDKKRVVTARTDRFSLSWLPPYDRWESFLSSAEEHWHRYRQVARPTKVQRLAVRFVNKIDIPQQQVEIKDYLRVGADVPAYLPQALLGFFLQITVPLEAFDATTQISSTLAKPPDESSTSLILDIDTWQVVDIDLSDQRQVDAISDRFARLRDAKNYVFESCITDATRRLID